MCFCFIFIARKIGENIANEIFFLQYQSKKVIFYLYKQNMFIFINKNNDNTLLKVMVLAIYKHIYGAVLRHSKHG